MRFFSRLLPCFLSFCFVFSGVGWGQPKPPSPSKNPRVKFALLNIHKSSKLCKRAYRIQINALSVVEAHASLKPLLEAQLQSWLRWALEAETSNSNAVDVWVQEELERYEKQDCETDRDTAQTPWERTLTVKHFFEDERFLSLSFEFVTFEGGAHESRQKQFVTWDKEAKAPLSLEALSLEAEPLLALAEEEFRKVRKLKPEDEFEANGYWFDKGKFRLSEQFALTECGLLFYYNPYEVAAYAVGPIEILLPFSKLKPLYKTPPPPPSKIFVKAFEGCPNALAPPPSPPKPTPKPRAPAKTP